MIPSLKISNKLLQYAKLHQVNHQLILIRFFHERLLYRVGQSRYRRQLILKGGNLLYAIQGQMARPTIDLDFSGQQISNDIDELQSVFKEIAQISGNDEVIFNTSNIKAEKINEHNRTRIKSIYFSSNDVYLHVLKRVLPHAR